MILLYILMIYNMCIICVVLLKSFPDLQTSQHTRNPWSPVTGVAMFGPGSRWFLWKHRFEHPGMQRKKPTIQLPKQKGVYICLKPIDMSYIYMCFSWMCRYKRIVYCFFLIWYIHVDRLLFGMERHCCCLRYCFWCCIVSCCLKFGFAP